MCAFVVLGLVFFHSVSQSRWERFFETVPFGVTWARLFALCDLADRVKAVKGGESIDTKITREAHPWDVMMLHRSLQLSDASSTRELYFASLISFACYGRPAKQMRTLHFCPVVSSSSVYLSFFLLFSSPNLSGRRVDVCLTSTHGVTLVRI